MAHHLFNFFKDTLTVPKVKDLVKQSSESYKDIDKIIANKSQELLLPKNDIDSIAMKDELKKYFNILKNTKTNEMEGVNINWNNEMQKIYTEV